MRQIITTLVAGFCVASLVGGAACRAAEWPASQWVFVDRYCSDCHDAAARVGGLDLAALSRDLTEAETLRRWVRVYDRVADVERPPPTEPQPDRGAKQAFLASLGPSLAAADPAQREVVLAKLQAADDGGGTLLDRPTVLLGSNLGNASSHSTENLPIVVAGGGFRHGQHLAFSQARNTPLPNVFVTILQRLGLETDRFASSTGTLTGLE